MGEFRYRAFISYSWADARWGNWLHHRLETYRTPAALVGKDGAHGPVRARLHPLFKDREEEAAGASIGDAVEKALAASEFLIVVCSPHSAKSRWVEREVAFFKANRDPAKVLALIVDGEPGSATEECFPRALTHAVGTDGEIGAPLPDAPLAADARISGDGKRRATLKLAAAMLGVGLDELVNRDERRRTIRMRIVVAASLALAAVMTTMAVIAINARNEAEFQRNEADGLVEFMLTDLRDKLEPVGRLDALDVVGARALDYYAAQKLDRLDADALGRRARALLLVGEISNLRGDSEEALAAFREAAATTAEQLERDPNNGQRVYDHAQSVFWVGYIAYTRDELEEAEKQFLEYRRLATRLVELDPANPEWQLESSYAETNLGVMLFEQDRDEEAEVAFAKGLSRMEAVVASEPWEAGRQVELGITVNWLGLVRSNLGKYSEALDLFRRETSIYEEILDRDPANTQASNRAAIALQFVGGELLNTGDLPGSIAAYERSLALNADLREIEPANTEWQETQVRALLYQGENMLWADRPSDALALLEQAQGVLGQMMATDPDNTIWSGELANSVTALAVQHALATNALDRAERLLQDYFTQAGEVERPDRTRMTRLAGDLRMARGDTAGARTAWTRALAEASQERPLESERLALFRRLGDTAQATQVASLLDQRGFHHPGFRP